MTTVTAQAFSNIAFIKYWGNLDHDLRIPSSGSISMNLDGLITRTEVQFDPALQGDVFILGGRESSGLALERVSQFLDIIRQTAMVKHFARVESENNFPTGSGIASSAAAFAALALAGSRAAGLELDERELSRLARRGSGSACRSVPGGFVEWLAGADDASSYAHSIAPPEHWDLVDCIAIVSQEPKVTGSTEGHALAGTSPLQAARVADAPRRLDSCRRAILERDFDTFAEVVELDSNLMHSVMQTSQPRLIYWQPGTLEVMHAVVEWRRNSLPVCYTIDAGPNVHVICLRKVAGQVEDGLRKLQGVKEVLTARPGGPASLLDL